MDKLEMLDLIQAIKYDEKLKKAKLKFKISLTLIPFVAVLIVFTIGISKFLFVSILTALIDCSILMCSKSDINYLKTKPSYKIFCDNYEVIKNKKDAIYKIFTKDGKIIYLNNGQSPEEINVERTNITYNNIVAKRQEAEKSESTTLPMGYLLSEQKQDFNKAIGRELELELLEESLMMESVNPLIIGPAGSGKTSLVKGFVYKMQNGEVCDELKNKKIGEITSSCLGTETQYRGQFEERMMKFIELAKKENVIFFIDEFHTIMGLGQTEHSNIDAANILKPYMSNGDIKIIGATTEEEYRNIIKKDPAFDRRFDIIKLTEPTDKILYQIVIEHVLNFEKKYSIKFGNNEIEKKAILESLIELTENKNRRYDSKINNPALILNIIERAFIKAKRNKSELVTVNNICDAVKSNKNLNESAVTKAKINISNLLNKKQNENKEVQKVIRFK